MSRPGRHAAATAAALLLLAQPATAGQFLLDASTHAMLADFGGPLGAAFDLALTGAWAPVPEVAVGLETAVTLPVYTGKDTTPTDVALRAAPVVRLRFGDDRGWGFVEMGCGVDGHLAGGVFEPVLVLVGAAGYIVAPPDLTVYFGFEIHGEVDMVGEIPTRTVGLGGILGTRF